MNKQLLIVSGFSGFIIACIAMYAAGFGIFRQNEYVAICLFLSLIVAYPLFPLNLNIPEKFQVLTKILDLALLIVGVLSLYSFVKVQKICE